LRLASCVSVEVVNGGDGRSTPGFASTLVTDHGRPVHKRLMGIRTEPSPKEHASA